jgi:hypothetical protein
MRLRDHVDVSTIDWKKQAHLTRRYAESLPPGMRRSVEIDRALACEAIAHSREVRSVSGIREPIEIVK